MMFVEEFKENGKQYLKFFMQSSSFTQWCDLNPQMEFVAGKKYPHVPKNGSFYSAWFPGG